MLNKHSKIQGGNIGIFIADQNRECRLNLEGLVVSVDFFYFLSR